jgi:hypothetical protein
MRDGGALSSPSNFQEFNQDTSTCMYMRNMAFDKGVREYVCVQDQWFK